MKKIIFLFGLILLLQSCNSDLKTESINNLNQNTIISETEKNSSDSVYYMIKNDSIYYYNHNTLVAKTNFDSKISFIDENTGKGYMGDKAFIIANTLMIKRNVISLGDFCHLPIVEKIEIFTLNKEHKVINSGEKKSLTYEGTNFTDIFVGRKITSPNSDWGIILIEETEELYGYLIVKSDGSIEEFKISKDTYITGNFNKYKFPNNNEIVWEEIGLKINHNGKIEYF